MIDIVLATTEIDFGLGDIVHNRVGDNLGLNDRGRAVDHADFGLINDEMLGLGVDGVMEESDFTEWGSDQKLLNVEADWKNLDFGLFDIERRDLQKPPSVGPQN